MAKVRLLEGMELRPGETGLGHLSLSKPVALVKGDRFIIRSPEETLGGGEAVESHARRYRRFPPDVIESLRLRAQGSAAEVIVAMLGTGGPLELPALRSRSDLSAAELELALKSLIEQGRVVGIGGGGSRLLFTAAGWEHLVREVVGTLGQYHREFPARLGISRAELGSRLKMGARHQIVLQRLLDEGVIVEDAGTVCLPDHQVRLTPAQQAKVDAFLSSLRANPYAPSRSLIPEADLLNLLVARQQVVKVAGDVVFSVSAYNEMVAQVTAYLESHGKVTVAQVRDMFHTSRKYAVAFLEHLDGLKITRRVGDQRVLY